MGFKIDKVSTGNKGKVPYKEVTASIDDYGDKWYVKGRIYVTDTGFYEASVVYDKPSDVDYNKFVKSFSIK